MYEAATAARVPMIVSNNSSYFFRSHCQSRHRPCLVPVLPAFRPDPQPSIARGAQAAGYEAVVVTLDQQTGLQLSGTRPPRLESRICRGNPYGVRAGRFWYHWSYLDEIRQMIRVPMLAKGILTAESAMRCIEARRGRHHVSNHGGRDLDYSPSSAEVLLRSWTRSMGASPCLSTVAFAVVPMSSRHSCWSERRVPWPGTLLGSRGVRPPRRRTSPSTCSDASSKAGWSTLASIRPPAARTMFP